MFIRLSEYRDVIAPGKLLNNTQVGQPYKRISYPEKDEYIRLSKFTIAAENTAYDGYVTEKIIQPFIHNSIPVYYGNPSVYKEFNKDAFVYMKSADEIDKMLSEVEYLDNNKNAYIEMLMQPVFNDSMYLDKKYEELEEFLVNIFSQDKESAYRRPRYFCAEEYEMNLKKCQKILARRKKIYSFLKR